MSVRRVAGRGLLAHELTHVVQQSNSQPVLQRSLAGCQELFTVVQIIDDWNELWREADRIAAEGA